MASSLRNDELVNRWEQEAPLYKKWDELVIDRIMAELRPLLEDRSLDAFIEIPIVPTDEVDERTEHGRLSCASPGVRARWTGMPLVSTTA
jgi:hypothetical protein